MIQKRLKLWNSRSFHHTENQLDVLSVWQVCTQEISDCYKVKKKWSHSCSKFLCAWGKSWYCIINGSLFNCCILQLHMLATSKLEVHNSVIHFFNLWAFHYFCLFIFVCLHFVLFCFQLGFLNVYNALLSWMDMPRGFLRVEVLALTIQWYSVEGPLKHVFSFPRETVGPTVYT